MLNFCNSKIYFNFEITNNKPFEATGCPYTDPEYIRVFVPNLSIVSIWNESLLEEHKNIGLTPSEFYSFILLWYNSCKFEKIFNWTEKQWFSDYIQCYKNLIPATKGNWNYEDHFFPNRKVLGIENIKYNNSGSPITILNNTLPEFSWMVEDYLVCQIKGTESLFLEELNKKILINVEKLRYHIQTNNSFFKEIIKIPLNLDIKNIKDIDFTNEYSFYYLYPTFPEDRIRTNYIHLKKIILEYQNVKK